jgi:signal peptidase I
MEPTLQIHDVLLANEFEYRLHSPRDGDIVIFKPPLPNPEDFIKRLMGSPGETLRIHQGIVYRNGVALNEPYIAEKPDYELEIKNYGIYVDGIPLDPTMANVPPRSMWQRLRRFARLGLRAARRHLRRRAGKRPKSLVHRPRLLLILAAEPYPHSELIARLRGSK